jgi:3'(2'), 5'-bisphosphate nucleotidase
VREEVGFDDPYDLGDAGDKRANSLILDRLTRDRPDDAVLSEEAVDDLSRVHADRVWIVDPVDGTREFSCRAEPTGRCTSRCGSARNAGGPGPTAASPTPRSRCRLVVRCTAPIPSPPAAAREGPIRITASASRPPAVLWRLRDRMDIQMVRIGSAAPGDGRGARRRRCLRARRRPVGVGLRRTCRVVQAAGLHASRLDGSPLIYNRRDPTCPTFLMCRAELADVLLDGIWSTYRDR